MGSLRRFLKEVTFEVWMVRRRNEPSKILGKSVQTRRNNMCQVLKPKPDGFFGRGERLCV